MEWNLLEAMKDPMTLSDDLEMATRLLRGEEVVKLTGYSRGKVYAMAAAGELPCIRSGRSIRFPLGALRHWIAANTRGGKA
jgi:excisionase family DNA binding protein